MAKKHKIIITKPIVIDIVDSPVFNQKKYEELVRSGVDSEDALKMAQEIKK